MLLTDGFIGLYENGEDVIQALVKWTTGPQTFGIVDCRGMDAIHVRKGVEDEEEDRLCWVLCRVHCWLFSSLDLLLLTLQAGEERALPSQTFTTTESELILIELIETAMHVSM